MVIPKDKNPLNPDNYNDESKLKKFLDNASSAKLKDDDIDMERFKQIKTIVEEFKKLNETSTESLKVLNDIFKELKDVNSTTKIESSNRIQTLSDSFNLNANRMETVFKGF